MSEDIVKRLRDRACPSGLPYTGDNPEEDHGHTDCWFHHQAADEIEYWRSEANKLAKLLMCEYVFVHERLIEQVDTALSPYFGNPDV